MYKKIFVIVALLFVIRCGLDEVLVLLFRSNPLTPLHSQSILMVKMLVILLSICSEIKSRKPLRTLLLFVREIKLIMGRSLPSKDQSSIESFLTSWSKEVISQEGTELEADRFGDKSSMIKTSLLSTNLIAYQWQTLVKTLMEVNFSLQLPIQLGLTESTLFSEK